MKNSKILSVLFFSMLSCFVFAQNPKLKKADKFYKLKEYTEAASLYEAGLQESESLSASTKLAYCYRMTNKMEAAEKLYREIVQNERARAITHFYYAEALMANQKYEEAKMMFLKYAELNPKDERGAKMANACDEVKHLRPVYKKVDILSFSQNADADDSAPIFFKGGIVFTSDRKSGINPLKQKTGWTGRDFLQIYFSKKTSDGKYQKPGSFSGKLNELNKHCGPVSFSADLTKAVFTRTGSQPGRGNTYNMQLYSAVSNDGSKWKKVKTLPFCNKESNYMHPALSPDGNTLFFVSDKPGGEGGTDIYKCERTAKGWSRPLNLGLKVNTSANEGFPFVSADGKLYFCSKGHTGYGGFDIFMTEQDEKGLWVKPVNIGLPVNSSYDDISFHLSENGIDGMFSSNRDGGDDDIYLFSIIEKADESEWMIAEETMAATEVPTEEDIPVIEESVDEAVSAEEVIAQNDKLIEELENETPKEENKITSDIIAEAPISETLASNDKIEWPEQESIKKEDVNEEVLTETTKIDTSEIIDAKINYEIKTPYEGSAIRIIPDETFTSKGGRKTEVLDEQKPDLSPAKPGESANSTMAPEMMYERPAPTVYPLIQLQFLVKKGTAIKGKTFRINGLEFPKGQYLVTPEATLQLNRLVDILNKHPELKIEIAAHTSSIGDDLENLELSRARAGAVMAQLINRGIAKERLSANGYGESRLLNHCTNDTTCSPKAHQENERVEVRVF